MKKLVFLFAAVVLIAISANVWAQTSPGYSTGQFPFPGATHVYNVTNTPGSGYVWKIYKTDLTNEITSSIPGEGIQAFTTSTNTVTIQWATNAAPDDEYILVVEETNSAGCKNTKALPVKVTASNFDLVVANGGNGCYSNSVIVAWAGGVTPASVTYDHGVATVSYTVTASGLGAAEDWTFKPNFTFSQTNIAETTVTVTNGASATVTPDGSGVYTLTGNQVATVTVVVDNNNTYNNSSAANAQDYTATMTLSDVSAETGAVEKDATNNDDVLTVARPNTTQIGFN